jgi:hypothetical protein
MYGVVDFMRLEASVIQLLLHVIPTASMDDG